MSTSAVIGSCLLAAVMIAAAGRKLTHRADVVAEYARVGVPEARLGQLALILLAGAAGLLLGLVLAPVGLAAAAGAILYFLLAIGAHFRHGDRAHVPTPIVIECIAVTVFVLQLLSL